MDNTELEMKISETINKLGINTEVFEYLCNDIYQCNRLIVLELESNIALSCNFIEELREVNINTELILVNSENQFPEDCCDTDCILAISPTGKHDSAINLIKNAKSNDSYIYSICSYFGKEIDELSDDIIQLSHADFEENTTIFLETICNRIRLLKYSLLKKEMEIDRYRVRHPQASLYYWFVDAGKKTQIIVLIISLISIICLTILVIYYPNLISNLP